MSDQNAPSEAEKLQAFEEDEDSLLKQFNSDFHQELFDSAIQRGLQVILKRKTEDFEKDSDIWLTIADSFFFLGLYPKAFEIYKNYLTLDKKDADFNQIWSKLAIIFREESSLKKENNYLTVEVYRRMVQTSPDTIEYWQNLVEATILLGDHAKAEEIIVQCEKLGKKLQKLESLKKEIQSKRSSLTEPAPKTDSTSNLKSTFWITFFSCLGIGLLLLLPITNAFFEQCSILSGDSQCAIFWFFFISVFLLVIGSSYIFARIAKHFIIKSRKLRIGKKIIETIGIGGIYSIICSIGTYLGASIGGLINQTLGTVIGGCIGSFALGSLAGFLLTGAMEYTYEYELDDLPGILGGAIGAGLGGILAYYDLGGMGIFYINLGCVLGALLGGISPKDYSFLGYFSGGLLGLTVTYFSGSVFTPLNLAFSPIVLVILIALVVLMFIFNLGDSFFWMDTGEGVFIGIIGGFVIASGGIFGMRINTDTTSILVGCIIAGVAFFTYTSLLYRDELGGGGILGEIIGGFIGTVIFGALFYALENSNSTGIPLYWIYLGLDLSFSLGLYLKEHYVEELFHLFGLFCLSGLSLIVLTVVAQLPGLLLLGLISEGAFGLYLGVFFWGETTSSSIKSGLSKYLEEEKIEFMMVADLPFKDLILRWVKIFGIKESHDTMIHEGRDERIISLFLEKKMDLKDKKVTLEGTGRYINKPMPKQLDVKLFMNLLPQIKDIALKRKQEQKIRIETEKAAKEAEVLKEQQNLFIATIERVLPTFRALLRKYSFTQLSGIQSNLAHVTSKDLPDTIQRTLKEKFDSLIEYLILQGAIITEKEKEFIYSILLAESQPIINDLAKLVSENEDEVQRRAKLAEEQAILAKKKQLSTALFGEEIVTREDVKKVEQYRSMTDLISDLMKSYAEWEKGGTGKKVDNKKQ